MRSYKSNQILLDRLRHLHITEVLNPDQVLRLGRARNLNARGLFQRSVVGSILGVGSNDWAHFIGKHLNFPNVLFVYQICSHILWNYVKFEAKNGHFSVVCSWCYIFMMIRRGIVIYPSAYCLRSYMGAGLGINANSS
jgi:hypothetical protein